MKAERCSITHLAAAMAICMSFVVASVVAMADNTPRITGTLAQSAGTSTSTYKPAVVIASAYANASTTGTSEQTLATVTLPANLLTVNGSSIRCRSVWYSTNTANTKTAKVYVGATECATQTATTTWPTSSPLTHETWLWRRGTNDQTCHNDINMNGSSNDNNVFSVTETESGAIAITFKGTSPNQAGDVKLLAYTCTYMEP